MHGVTDVGAVTGYLPATDTAKMWQFSYMAASFDIARSAHAQDHFLLLETRIGTWGDVCIMDSYPSPERFRLMQLYPVAFGAMSLVYWSAVRWSGGHWPQWGAVLSWNAMPEPDFPWVQEIGALLRTWGPVLSAHPVRVDVAILTDFDQRMALEIYPNIEASHEQWEATFDLFHRSGLGVATLTVDAARDSHALAPFRLVVLSCLPCFDDLAVVAALDMYVREGGTLLVLPFVGYQTFDGAFRSDGLGADLTVLTGCVTETVRAYKPEASTGLTALRVFWEETGLTDESLAALGGWCELLRADDDVEVLARFTNPQPVMGGRPAVLRRRHGAGVVIRLGYWPQDDRLGRLVLKMLPGASLLVDAPLPAGVHAVPRTDGSIFLMNTRNERATATLRGAWRDRLSGRCVAGVVTLGESEVLWLEPA